MQKEIFNDGLLYREGGRGTFEEKKLKIRPKGGEEQVGR